MLNASDEEAGIRAKFVAIDEKNGRAIIAFIQSQELPA